MAFDLELKWFIIILFFTEEANSWGNGWKVSDMVLAWRKEDDGYTEVNGMTAQKVAMA